MAKSRDYLPVPWDWLVPRPAKKGMYVWTTQEWIERHYPTPRRRAKYWKGNRRSGYHRFNKRLVNGKIRRTPIDPGGLSLPPYTRKCVAWMDN